MAIGFLQELRQRLRNAMINEWTKPEGLDARLALEKAALDKNIQEAYRDCLLNPGKYGFNNARDCLEKFGRENLKPAYKEAWGTKSE